jgi:hypothetical protein
LFGVIAALECFLSEFTLIFDLVEENRDQLVGLVGEAGSVSLAVVTASGTVNIMHSLEVLGDLAGVHAAPFDSVLVGERFSRGYVWTDGIVPLVLVFGIWDSVPACEALYNSGGQSSRSGVD